jgi:hypothetical protein
MVESYPLRRFDGAEAQAIQDALENSEIVFFERSPIPLPSEDDLTFLRAELPQQYKVKNVSYHPESDSIPRFDAAPAVRSRVKRILEDHRRDVAAFFESNAPGWTPGWTVGTTSFRGLEERGRNLKARSNSEIVHIDAGAYGATNGDRILRFFVNVNPSVDRVWGTKGSFAELFAEHAAFSAAARGKAAKLRLEKSLSDKLYSGVVRGLSTVYPLLKVIDSSPYDRAMRRIHNYMKETASFRADMRSYRELRFPPYSAWSVFTDGRSHSVVSGQFALVTTLLIPLANCRRPELTPYHILAAAS